MMDMLGRHPPHLKKLKFLAWASRCRSARVLRRMRMRVVCGVTIASSILSACGWHLQGVTRLPTHIQSVQIQALDRYSDFYRELHDQLTAAGVTVSEADAAAQLVVQVSSDKFGQHVGTVSARNTPEQYIVFYEVEYSVASAGQTLIAKESAEASTNYSYDTTAILAKQREQYDLQRALARDLASRIIRRIVSVSSHSAVH